MAQLLIHFDSLAGKQPIDESNMRSWDMQGKSEIDNTIDRRRTKQSTSGICVKTSTQAEKSGYGGMRNTTGKTG